MTILASKRLLAAAALLAILGCGGTEPGPMYEEQVKGNVAVVTLSAPYSEFRLNLTIPETSSDYAVSVDGPKGAPSAVSVYAQPSFFIVYLASAPRESTAYTVTVSGLHDGGELGAY
jgi:hypothetical protein